MANCAESTTQSTLQHVASVATFESTDLVTFRNTLKKCLKQTLVCESDEVLLPYHRSGIPWMQLCKAHDVRGMGCPHSSALEEVLLLLCNPTVIPRAYSLRIFMCLLNVMLNRTEKATFRSSELLLLDSLVALLNWVPALSLLPTLDAYQGEYFEADPASNNLDADRLHKYATVLGELSRRIHNLWFRCAALKLFLKMAKTLDDIDIKRLQEPRQTPADDGTMCLQCQKQIIPLTITRIHRRGVSLLRLLDDEGVIEEYGKPPIGSISSGRECRCPYESQQPLAKACAFTQLPFKLVTLRSRAYEKALQILFLLRQYRTTSSILLRDIGLHCGPANALDKILDLTCQFPHSPSLRLSLMLVVDAIGSNGLDFVTRRLWKRVDTGGERHHFSELRIWSELIIESSYFDDPQRCWRYMEPLLMRVLAHCTQCSDELVQLDSKAYHLLRSVSSVLSRRRPALKATDSTMKAMFQDFVARVSLSFGELRFWITSDMKDGEIEEIICTLQSVGIVGLHCSEERGPVSNVANWPFTYDNSVRGAHCRMGPHVTRNQLLSEPEDANELQRLRVRDLGSRKPTRDPETGLAILDYLNDDMLRVVFAFLNHVELVRVGGLNKLCHSLTGEETHWKILFQRTYGILRHADNFDNVESWRNLFVEKYRCEKALKFKYSHLGWKYRTCGYVGCNQVMRSAEQQVRHHLVHEKRYKKKLERMAIQRMKKTQTELNKKEAAANKAIRDSARKSARQVLRTMRESEKAAKKEMNRKRKADMIAEKATSTESMKASKKKRLS